MGLGKFWCMVYAAMARLGQKLLTESNEIQHALWENQVIYVCHNCFAHDWIDILTSNEIFKNSWILK